MRRVADAQSQPVINLGTLPVSTGRQVMREVPTGGPEEHPPAEPRASEHRHMPARTAAFFPVKALCELLASTCILPRRFQLQPIS